MSVSSSYPCTPWLRCLIAQLCGATVVQNLYKINTVFGRCTTGWACKSIVLRSIYYSYRTYKFFPTKLCAQPKRCTQNTGISWAMSIIWLYFSGFLRCVCTAQVEHLLQNCLGWAQKCPSFDLTSQIKLNSAQPLRCTWINKNILIKCTIAPHGWARYSLAPHLNSLFIFYFLIH